MPRQFRRVVTGYNSDGKSIIWKDGPPPQSLEPLPELILHEVWETGSPASNPASAREPKPAPRSAESQAARRTHHLIQEEIDTVDRKRISGEKRLYSGTVTNTKELQDLQDEGVALKRRIVALEDRQLEAMIAQEDAETAAARGDEKADVEN